MSESKVWSEDNDKTACIRNNLRIFVGGEYTFGPGTSVSACAGTGKECDQTRAGRRQSDGVKLQYPFLAKGLNLL